MFSEWWWSSGAEANKEDGFEVKNSLRFRGAQTLTRTITSSDGPATWSFWVKKTEVSDSADQAIFDIAATCYMRFLQNKIRLFGGDGSTNYDSTILFRDPSAWYHIVIVGAGPNNLTDGKCYVNGVDIFKAHSTAIIFQSLGMALP